MNEFEKFEDWLKNTRNADEETYAELMSIRDDEDQISDRFYRDLQFGTGGLRGIMAAGTNRINRYSIGRAAAGLAKFLVNEKQSSSVLSVAIAYDSRINSELFARVAAGVLSSYEIQVFLYESLRPTPQLSFAVRQLKCDAGIVITASHNPSEYNGFKVYGRDGGQITSEMATKITEMIRQLNYFDEVLRIPNENFIQTIGNDLDEAYYAEVLKLMRSYSVNPSVDIKLVYTPLHGSGNVPVQEVLKRMGFEQLTIVKSQQEPDGNFPTVKSPNPENPDVFEHAIVLAKHVGADVIFATDPDCDRVGVAVLNSEGQYQLLNGNQMGALLINYITSTRTQITSRDAVVKTIVTSSLGASIAKSRGATIVETLTGFKYIGEKIGEFEESGEYDFLFGYEESYGFLAGTFVRDKDAVIASALIALMAADAKYRKMTLIDTLNEIQSIHGYYIDHLESFEFHGQSGAMEILDSVSRFRDFKLLNSKIEDIQSIEDFDNQLRTDMISGLTSEIILPKENVIKIKFMDQSWVAIRPSGTEPKLKIYYSVYSDNADDLTRKFVKIKGAVDQILTNNSLNKIENKWCNVKLLDKMQINT